ncbi:glycosyltransferase involved in cell wall biosynthesis [Thermocatellispora tengchongensis]|uniref:Glycosyltransferase involved in cell wall biosynthesis n=1 Tax=Thermocatellispora tengchongensis TaxID=1073253 RepID=A0A840PC19_9ACTN|nr:glycosyltransferase family 4 protein [Thermocatellispora tengchongensis]MBB5138964.1 glycosyltransferase involved in cell wall biosynthesis [Thermocatellispora tengchongensis]
MRRVIARRAVRLLEAINRRRAEHAPPPSAAKVRILLLHANGMGGTIRTVLNLAGYLARERDVEIVSVLREAAEPFFPVPPGVRISYLDDRLARRGPLRWALSRRPSRLIPKEEAAYHRFTLYTDLALLRFLWRTRDGVLISTRPGLNLITARFAAPGVITIGQEHVGLTSHAEPIQTLIKRRYRRLDAVVTLTKADLRNYRATLRRRPGVLTRIPNALTELGGPPSDPAATTVVAAGRLTRVKGFHKLIDAWRSVAARHPGWTLRIYGAGVQEENLAKQIHDLGLCDHAFLMGPRSDIGPELAKASVYALSSRREGFSMTILEAMSKGMAVVSFNCPDGPKELITDGHDGLLVRRKNAEGMAEALCRVIEDEELRRSLGRAALQTAALYTPEIVGKQWDDLLARLVERRSAPAAPES